MISRTKFPTSEQFKNSNSTVEWRFEHLHGFQWSVGAIDGMRCSLVLGQPIRFIEVFDSYIDICSDVFTCVYLHKSLVVPRDRVKHAPLESFLIMDSIWNVTPESLVTWVGVLGSENGDRPDSARSADLKAQVRIHFQLFFKFSGTNARSLTGLSLYSSELFSLNQCPLK
jgi:hypothetical protein